MRSLVFFPPLLLPVFWPLKAEKTYPPPDWAAANSGFIENSQVSVTMILECNKLPFKLLFCKRRCIYCKLTVEMFSHFLFCCMMVFWWSIILFSTHGNTSYSVRSRYTVKKRLMKAKLLQLQHFGKSIQSEICLNRRMNLYCCWYSKDLKKYCDYFSSSFKLRANYQRFFVVAINTICLDKMKWQQLLTIL